MKAPVCAILKPNPSPMNGAEQEEDESMLIVGVKVGRQVILEDHTVITVSGIDRVNEEVKIGFDSETNVQRVGNPQTVLKAARIMARSKKGLGKKLPEMEKLPVYVASVIQDDKPQVKAAFTTSKASFPGATLTELSDDTNKSLASHQFVVMRCSSNREVKQVRYFAKEMVGWPVLDQFEAEDSTIYLLMVRTTAEKTGGDVAYYDAATIL